MVPRAIAIMARVGQNQSTPVRLGRGGMYGGSGGCHAGGAGGAGGIGGAAAYSGRTVVGSVQVVAVAGLIGAPAYGGTRPAAAAARCSAQACFCATRSSFRLLWRSRAIANSATPATGTTIQPMWKPLKASVIASRNAIADRCLQRLP